MQKKLINLAVIPLIWGNSVSADIVQFSTAPIPTSDIDKRSILSSQYVYVEGVGTYDVNYNILLRSGDKPAGSAYAFGTLVDINGSPLISEDGSTRVSYDNDFTSLVMGKDGKKYMVSQFETRPAAVYLTELSQDSTSGKLTAGKTRPLDFSSYNGGWVHCAGSVTPWGNHLGSEEYPPDAYTWITGEISDYNAAMVSYFPVAQGASSAELPALAQQHVNPYDYGFSFEVEITDYDNVSVTKHYAMGRVAIELAYVMPNQKTVYISDDGSYVGLFRFEADKAGDLSSGELFAAKVSQTSTFIADENDRSQALNNGEGTLSWVSLGRASSSEVETFIKTGIKFTDMFDVDVAGCTTITTRNGSECISVKKGMELAASRLETSRYAALKGASIEFEKMEGITHDEETNTMYLAISRVIKGMSDGKGDMSFPYNYCGTVFKIPLDENYIGQTLKMEVSGMPRLIKRGASSDNPYPADGPYAANECDLDAISEPDNLTFIPGTKTLIIGEDTGKHQNDMIWAYNLDSKSLTRIQTTPYGSETTSPYFYRNYGGFSYMTSVIQHPFGESDTEKAMSDADKRGYTGYLGPWPGY